MGVESGMNTTEDSVFCLDFEVEAEHAIVLEEALAALGFTCSSWTNRDTGKAVVRIMAASTEQACAWREEIVGGLADWGELLGGAVPVPVLHHLRREDWAESWKRHFHAFRVSERLVVKPSWEEIEIRPDDVVIDMDPGMCFGTGYHGTTRACLEFMEALADELGPVPFLDAGCGSGILSLAAVKLGFHPVHAFDHDPQAVEVARENLLRQGVTHVGLEIAELAEYRPSLPPRVVVVNMLAVMLLEHCEHIVGWFDRQSLDGRLVLSGILNEQYDAVLAAFTGAGVEELTRRRIDEWTSGCFRVSG